jgi:hypothetical protein
LSVLNTSLRDGVEVTTDGRIVGALGPRERRRAHARRPVGRSPPS